MDNIGHWDLGITEKSLSLTIFDCIVVLVNIRITDVFLVFRFCFVYDHRCVEIQRLKVTFSFFSSTISPIVFSIRLFLSLYLDGLDIGEHVQPEEGHDPDEADS